MPINRDTADNMNRPIGPIGRTHEHAPMQPAPGDFRPLSAGTICTRRATAGELIGQACMTCGHTNLMHGGPHNPNLDHCLICRLGQLAQQLVETERRLNGRP